MKLPCNWGLCRAAHALTLSPVAAILPASWSTATLEGATTSTWLWAVVHRWYTMEALVTVLPACGGPGGGGGGCGAYNNKARDGGASDGLACKL